MERCVSPGVYRAAPERRSAIKATLDQSVDANRLAAITAAVARLREQVQTLPVYEIEGALVFDAFDNLEREVVRVTEEVRVMAVARY